MTTVLSYRPDSQGVDVRLTDGTSFRASWADDAIGLRVATVNGRGIYVPENLIAVRQKAWFRQLVWRLIDTYERSEP